MHGSGNNPEPRRDLTPDGALHALPRPRPLLVPAIALMAGIGLSEAVGPLATSWRSAVVALPAVALAAFLLALWRRLHRHVLLGLVSAIALAAGIARHQQVYDRPPHHIAHALADEPVLTRLAGRIVTPPIERPPPKLNPNPFLPLDPAPRTQFVLAMEELRTTEPATPATGQVRVSVEAAGLGLKLGQLVQVTGRLWQPRGPRNPGEMDWARWFRRQQIDAGMSVEGGAYVSPLPGEGSPWYGLIAALRSRAQSLLLEPYADLETSESARLLDVMILGQRSIADHALNEAFLRAGGLHFLAVSGFNVMVLAGTAWWVVRRVLRRGDRTAAVVAVLLTVLFALVAEPNAPILRATIAVVLVALARATRRPICALSSLALAAACILIVDPNALFGAAFQLTFVQVLGLIVVFPKVWRAFYPGFSRVVLHPGMYGARTDERDHGGHPAEAQTASEYGRLRPACYISALVLTCACTWASALPLVLWHFGRLSSWGWLATIPLTPLVTLVTLLSLFTIAANAALPPLGALLGFALQRSADLLLWSVRLFEDLPGAVVDCQPPPIWLVIVTYGVLLLLVAVRRTPREVGPRPGPRRPPPVASLTLVKVNAAALVALAWIGWIVLPASRGVGHAVHVLAVGNGSAVSLTTPDGSAAVLDVGTDTNSDVGETAGWALHAIGIRRVDDVFVSHAHFDHYSGLPALMRRLPVERWLTNTYFLRSKAQRQRLKELLAQLPQGSPRPTALHAGDQLRVADATLDVLWPPEGLDESRTVNDGSLVLRITARGHTVLVTGDVEARGLADLLEAEREARISLNADVLIAPHHGKVFPGVTERFYAAVAPRVVIVSTRTPRPELESLVARTLGPIARVLLTGEVGSVTVRITPTAELRVETPYAGRPSRSPPETAPTGAAPDAGA